MKRILCMVILCMATMLLTGCGGNANKKQAGDAPPETTTLTVKEVVVDLFPPHAVTELKMLDEKGNAIPSFRIAKQDQWFENATINKVTVPAEITLVGNGSNIILSEDSKLLFEFNVNANLYSVGVGAGSKFAVQKTAEGKYNLLPEETAKLSPPPATEK